jgi:hypothetical protein
VNTTDEGAPQTGVPHAEPNSAPEARTDLRLVLRKELMGLFAGK